MPLRKRPFRFSKPHNLSHAYHAALSLIVFAIATLGLSLPPMLQAQPSKATLPIITVVRAAHGLTQADALAGYPVRLRAVVTFYDPMPDPKHDIFFVADATGGVFVTPETNPSTPLTAGDLVEVTGVTGPGNFAPIIEHAEIRKIASSHLPLTAPRVSMADLLTGKRDSQWIEIEGVVRAVRMTSRHLYLEIAMRDGDISAMTTKGSDEENQTLVRSLIDARITVRGNAGTIFNTQRQMTGAHLIFPGKEAIAIEDAAPEVPFASPVSHVDSLLHFSSASGLQHRVHVQGIVTLQWPGHLLCIDDRGHGLCAQVDQAVTLKRGDPVDLIGFPMIGAFTPTLVHASYQIASRTPEQSRQPNPTEITADKALLGDYDAELVTIEALLIGHDRSASEPTLVLSSGKAVFLAVLPPKYLKEDLEMREGSLLRITGICSMHSDGSKSDPLSGFPVATSFRVLSESPEDIRAIEGPSWWNASHTLYVLTFALAFALAALCRMLILGRRVKRQNSTIRDSEERFRHLATHDSLTQLPNRASVLGALDDAIQMARNNNSSVCIALIDLDHFKQINDSLGHLAGDEVLRESARRLASAIRSTDTIGRYGGEEFLIVFREMEHEHGVTRCEVVRKTLCAQPICWEGNELTITCSIGVVSSQMAFSQLPALVSAADRAMYMAKTQGRNRVMSLQTMAAEEASVHYRQAIPAVTHG